jgi:uncharacterized protein (TIGR04206 family)
VVDRPRRRLLALLALLAVPWSVQFFGPGSLPTLRFAWGMVSLRPVAASLLLDYLRFGRAPIVFTWLLASGLYALAAAATLGAVAAARREGAPPGWGRAVDRAVAGLLALAGAANLSVAWTFSVQPGRVALPVGTLLLWAVAWRYFGLRSILDR